MKTYLGWRTPHTNDDAPDREVVRVIVRDGHRDRDLDPRLDLVNHSPTGFEWGYAGSGPSQLAMAICVDLFGERIGSDPGVYQLFKRDVVVGFDARWQITEAKIRDWFRETVQNTCNHQTNHIPVLMMTMLSAQQHRDRRALVIRPVPAMRVGMPHDVARSAGISLFPFPLHWRSRCR